MSVYAKNGWYPQSTKSGRQAWIKATTNWTWKPAHNSRKFFKLRSTYHLNDSECFFPPQIFTELWPKSSQTVVGVHNHVYTAVNERKEGIVSPSTKFKSNPDAPRNERMMDNVKCWNVSKFFPQNKEYLKIDQMIDPEIFQGLKQTVSKSSAILRIRNHHPSRRNFMASTLSE